MSYPSGQAPPAPPTCYRHQNRLTYVTCVRCGRPICPDCMTQASVGYQCPECVRAGRRSTRPARTVFGGSTIGDRALATRGLIGTNLLVFLLILVDGGGFTFGVTGKTSHLFDNLAGIPYVVNVVGDGVQQGIAQGQYWRLLTEMFLHFGILHIVMNMWALWVVGRELERALGPVRFLVLYFLSGLGGSVLGYLLGPKYVIAAGASGAVFGLFGALWVVAKRLRVSVGQIAGLIVINLVITFTIPNIDWRAHVGGLVTGGLVGVIMAYAPQRNRTTVQAAGSVLIAVVLVMLTVIRTSMLTG